MQDVLPLYGFPTRLSSWIMSCVKSAQFSVVVNGRGDGFLSPKCGLRQGCALSPYLFILGMDVLARKLNHRLEARQIAGLKLAHSAQPLTNCMYADDLLILGSANQQEAQNILSALEEFSAASGQCIGPEKSTIWFSEHTPHQDRLTIASILQVPLQQQSKTYLGVSIAQTREAYDFLIEKVSDKIQTWKCNLLSQAGRVILIRSVLQALPIYFMSTTTILRRVIEEITKRIRKFFWGKVDQDRYMAFIAWNKILAPIRSGGLGLRDLSLVNDAMLTKYLWYMAAGSQALWVQVLKAKYFPRGDLWLTKRLANSTIFWRSMMRVRSKLLSILCWSVGNGEKCQVFNQPWFPGAEEFFAQSRQNSNMKLTDLLLEGAQGWDVNKLIECFGHQASITIISHVKPPSPGAGQDRLLFQLSPNGAYSVSNMYKHMAGHLQLGDNSQTKIWECVWKRGNVMPRVRLFMWKLLHNGLPLGGAMAARLRRGSGECANCGGVNEDALHMTMKCPFARLCWLTCEMGINVEGFQSVKQLMEFIIQTAPESYWDLMANCLWGIWRCRNSMAYAGVKPEYKNFSLFLNNINIETAMKASYKKGLKGQSGQLQEVIQTDYECHSDGSWTNQWNGGTGYIIHQREQLVLFVSCRAMVCSPLQAEARALMEAIHAAIDLGIQSCTFYSDNEILVKVCTDLGPPLEADWKAYKEVFDIWKMVKHNHLFQCIHISRSHNAMADHLAKNVWKDGAVRGLPTQFS